MALPLVGVFFTSGQIATVLSHAGDQQLRSVLASIDILLATATSNAIVLSSLLQDKGYKKTKYKYDAGGELQKIKSNNNGRKAARDRWGSDEDLMMASSDDRSSVAIGMEPLSPDGNALRAPPKARMQEIRVNQTWEVAVEDADPEKQPQAHVTQT